MWCDLITADVNTLNTSSDVTKILHRKILGKPSPNPSQTIFLLITTQTDFRLVFNQKENCQYDHIRWRLKGSGKKFLLMAYGCDFLWFMVVCFFMVMISYGCYFLWFMVEISYGLWLRFLMAHKNRKFFLNFVSPNFVARTKLHGECTECLSTFQIYVREAHASRHNGDLVRGSSFRTSRFSLS